MSLSYMLCEADVSFKQNRVIQKTDHGKNNNVILHVLITTTKLTQTMKKTNNKHQ